VAISQNARPSADGRHGQNPHIAAQRYTARTRQSAEREGDGERSLLIVEDSRTMRAVMRRHLQATGCVLLEAGDGEEALEVIGDQRPDVVLLDVQLPRLSGFDVLAAMRDDPALGDSTVVLVTSATDPQVIAEGLRRGAHDYLRKPFQPAELLARVHAALRMRALADDLRARDKDRATAAEPDGAFDLQARALVSRSRRHGSGLAALAVAVEPLGRPPGQGVERDLQRNLARRLRDRLRLEDAAGPRADGGFVVLAPDTGPAGAAALADGVRAALPGDPPAVAVAVGWTTWAGPDDDLDALLARAERALAAARAAGGAAGGPG
jgi:two-component system, cell cycle response regulator